MSDRDKAGSDTKDLLDKAEDMLDDAEDVVVDAADKLVSSNLIPAGLISLIVALLVVAAAWFFREPLGWSSTNNEQAAVVENLQGKIGALEERLEKLGSGPDLKPIQQQIAGLKDEVATLKTASNKGPNEEALKAVSQQVEQLGQSGNAQAGRIQQLERALKALLAENQGLQKQIEAQANAMNDVAALASSAANNPSGNTGALVMAAVRLDEAVVDGRAFSQEVTLANRLASGKEEFSAMLNDLTPFANNGVATAADLESEFVPLIQKLKEIEASGSDDSLMGTVLGQVASVVSVRRTDGTEGLDGVLARTEAALSSGKVDRAITELAQLEEVYQPVVADWLARANDSQKARSLSNSFLLQVLDSADQ